MASDDKKREGLQSQNKGLDQGRGALGDQSYTGSMQGSQRSSGMSSGSSGTLGQGQDRSGGSFRGGTSGAGIGSGGGSGDLSSASRDIGKTSTQGATSVTGSVGGGNMSGMTGHEDSGTPQGSNPKRGSDKGETRK